MDDEYKQRQFLIEQIKNQLQIMFDCYSRQFGFSDEERTNTPKRLAKMFVNEYFQGVEQNPEKILGSFFDTDSEDLVIQKDIPLISVCSHHLVPFIGHANIGYIPDGKLVGLSKLGRIVDCYARRPQLQERLTSQIADALYTYLKPKGCMVIVVAEHGCVTTRGVRKNGSKTVTSALRGLFMKDRDLREEFLNLLKI